MLNIKVKVLYIRHYQLKNIRPYLKDFVNDLKKTDTLEIQLITANIFFR